MAEQQHTRETAQERDARIFPVAVRITRRSQEAGAEDPTEADVDKLVDAWRDPNPATHRFETRASARQILVEKWPGTKSREGRAKWGDYDQLSLWGKEWKEIGTRAYQIKLPDGTWGHRCLFEMSKKQRQQARATLVKQRIETGAAIRDIDRFERLLTQHKVPASRAPSDFFQVRQRVA